MSKRLTVQEFGIVKKLVAQQNELIAAFENCCGQAVEPQIKEAFQKLCASAKNHKRKLLRSLEAENE